MGLLLKDPATHAPGPDDGPGGVLSTMPAGGIPADDRKFLAWIDAYAEEANARVLDRFRGDEVTPKTAPVRAWQLMNHAYKALSGLSFSSGLGPTYSHKIRFLAIQFRLRPEEFRAELDAYVPTIFEDASP